LVRVIEVMELRQRVGRGGVPLAAHTVPRKKPSEKKDAAMAMAIRTRFIGLHRNQRRQTHASRWLLWDIGELPHDRTDGVGARAAARDKGVDGVCLH
jgi:hypothetical protein